MALKSWEKNLEESKILTKEENNYFINALLSMDVETEEIDIGDIHAFIGQVENEKRKENMKTNRENKK
jgi:hypothetical protein